MQLYTIDTGYFKLDGGAMFGVVPKSIWNRLQPADENNLCTWAMRCLLVEDGDRLILIDTGIGDKQTEKFFSHYYLHGDATLTNSLAKHGFSTDDITDVFLTHLHFDHAGGSIVRNGEELLPAFKNANYWSHRQHWNHAVKPNAREKASFLHENIAPIMESGQLQFVDTTENNLVAMSGNALTGSGISTFAFSGNFNFVVVNGHTESMMLPLINYRNRSILYSADLFPCVSHLPLPYVMAYDIQPLKTMLEKELVLNDVLENDTILYFEHDPTFECCSIQKIEKGIREKETFRLDEI